LTKKSLLHISLDHNGLKQAIKTVYPSTQTTINKHAAFVGAERRNIGAGVNGMVKVG
jgi:hypothetical protein